MVAEMNLTPVYRRIDFLHIRHSLIHQTAELSDLFIYSCLHNQLNVSSRLLAIINTVERFVQHSDIVIYRTLPVDEEHTEVTHLVCKRFLQIVVKLLFVFRQVFFLQTVQHFLIFVYKVDIVSIRQGINVRTPVLELLGDIFRRIFEITDMVLRLVFRLTLLIKQFITFAVITADE